MLMLYCTSLKNYPRKNIWLFIAIGLTSEAVVRRSANYTIALVTDDTLVFFTKL